MKKLVTGIVAHVDAGKTTLSESILYQTGSIRHAGRVDTQSTLLDNDQIEKQRGITIFSGEASFSIGDRTYYLIDTPGHLDFSAETERAVASMDYAILLLDAYSSLAVLNMPHAQAIQDSDLLQKFLNKLPQSQLYPIIMTSVPDFAIRIAKSGTLLVFHTL